MESREFVDEIAYEIIGAGIEIQKIMGKGLLENIYQACMQEEMKLRGLTFLTELKIQANYKGKDLLVDFRCDFFVENCVVVELKSVKEMIGLFDAQLLTYMSLLKAPKGVLLNFTSNNLFREGQKTFVSEYYRELPEV